jgi:hypothetical protein
MREHAGYPIWLARTATRWGPGRGVAYVKGAGSGDARRRPSLSDGTRVIQATEDRPEDLAAERGRES